MPVPAPPIDPRSFDEIVAQTEQLLQRYSAWRPPAHGSDPGQALVRIFARLAELVVERLNRAPDKNFLAFLDLVGLDLLPPQPARVPLTFQLAAGSTTDALVPARTTVAAIPAEGETKPVIFETERELVVTRSQLVAALAREPGRDLYSDNTDIVTRQASGDFPVFQGDRPIEHRLCLGHSKLFGIDVLKTITLSMKPAENDKSWLSAVKWAYGNGSAWKLLEAAGPPGRVDDAWQVILPDVPVIPITEVGDKKSAWLCGRLTTPLPRGELIEVDAGTAGYDLQQHDLIPDAGFADDVRLDFSQRFYPFGQITPRSIFYLSSTVAFSKPGARVTIGVDLDAARPARPSSDLVLAWEYWDGENWQKLGESSPTSTVDPQSLYDFTDETQVFTRDGAIAFRCPAGWANRSVNDVTGFWLRARIETGNYGSRADYKPPVVERLILSYAWSLPRIDTIQARVDIQRAGLLPDLAFTNQLPVDPTKDFLPFGEKPRFSDTFYLASRETFSKSGPDLDKYTVNLGLTPSDLPSNLRPDPTRPVELTWEYSNGVAWKRIGASSNESPFIRDSADYDSRFADNTKAFTTFSGTDPVLIKFEGPPDWQPTDQVNGQKNYWLRVRITKGDYGVEARYDPVIDPATDKPKPDPNTGLPIYQLVPASFRPPSIKSITLSYSYTSPLTSLDYTLTDNDFAIVDRSQAARTDGQLFNPYTLTTDTRPTMYLGFQRPAADTGFANRSTALYFSVAEVLYGGSTAEGGAVAEPAAVVWEYWNGSRWARLGARDETQGFSRRGLVTFIGPPDFRRSTEFRIEAFWLRARWDRGEYATPPQLRRVLTNTTWATHTLSIQNEILGSSIGEPNQVFRTAKAPVLPGQRIEVREPELPSAAERAVIEAEEDEDAITTVLDASGRPVEIWVRWHEAPDFYESGPRSRHYILDRLTGEIRFGDGRRGLAPLQGRANVRAAWYQTGGGLQGNRSVGSITQLKSAVPYVDSVTNWESSGGASAQETLEAVKIRGPKTLRHRDRAVAIADFEDLAFQASPNVARVKGIAAQGSQDAGSVGLIIVPRSPVPQPIPSLELLGRVEDYIEARLAPTVDLWVAGPDWLRVTVAVEIVPVSIEAATDVQATALARLATFLHPLTGGLDGQGWAFGRKPYRSDLHALIEGTPGVDHVRRLTVAEEGDVSPDRFLVYSGHHQIAMVGGAG